MHRNKTEDIPFMEHSLYVSQTWAQRYNGTKNKKCSITNTINRVILQKIAIISYRPISFQYLYIYRPCKSCMHVIEKEVWIYV